MQNAAWCHSQTKRRNGELHSHVKNVHVSLNVKKKYHKYVLLLLIVMTTTMAMMKMMMMTTIVLLLLLTILKISVSLHLTKIHWRSKFLTEDRDISL